MNEQDIHNMLVAGLPIDVQNVGVLTPLTIKQVFSMGESIYNSHLSNLLIDRDRFEDADGLKDYDNFQLLIALMIQDAKYRQDVLDGLEVFFNYKPNLHVDDYSMFIYFQDASRQINQGNFDDIQSLIKLANYLKIEKEEERTFANERARKMWEMIQRNKKKSPPPKSDMNLHSLYSSISCRFGDYSTVNNMTIYQLYDAYQRLNNVDNVQNTYHGIYSGTVDGKKIKQSELNWAKIIQDNK